MKHLRAALPLALIFVLAACGGGGTTNTPPSETPPIEQPPVQTPPTTPPTTPPPPATPSDPNPNDDLQLVEFEVIQGEFGDRGVGIVRNDGVLNIEFVSLTVTFYDASNNIVASEDTYTNLDIIQPGETSPFSISASSSFGNFERYEIGAEWRQTDEVAIRGIDVIDTEVDNEEFSSYLRGQVINNSGQNLEFVEVVFSCRNSAGKLVDAGNDYIEADVLAPGVTSNFEAYLSSDDADTCEAVAEGRILN